MLNFFSNSSHVYILGFITGCFGTKTVQQSSYGRILVSYEVKPTIINSDTDTDFVIEIASEYANLIPLYIAGELYKDDDLTLSTMYMNEFMTLVDNYANNKYGFPTPTIERIYSMEG